ncbi:MAG: ankyrin repeat domain-containing protein [Bryobacteraceae bacterium]
MPEDTTPKANMAPTSSLPLWVRILGVLLFAGTFMLFARLIWEETVWTWERGPQMVGFSLAHDWGAVLFLFPPMLVVWTVGVVAATLWKMHKKGRISPKRWVAIGSIVLLFVVGGLPEGFWQRAFISRMAKSARAGDIMLYAAYRGDLATVKALVSHGVPVDARDRAYWRTALQGAAAAGHAEAIRFLVSSGAAINAVDRSGDSPLEMALANRQEGAADVLAALGGKRIAGDQAQRDKAIKDQVQEVVDDRERARKQITAH